MDKIKLLKSIKNITDTATTMICVVIFLYIATFSFLWAIVILAGMCVASVLIGVAIKRYEQKRYKEWLDIMKEDMLTSLRTTSDEHEVNK